MMNNRRPYPSYKYSGVEWLGYVPEHWDLRTPEAMCGSNG